MLLQFLRLYVYLFNHIGLLKLNDCTGAHLFYANNFF